MILYIDYCRLTAPGNGCTRGPQKKQTSISDKQTDNHIYMNKQIHDLLMEWIALGEELQKFIINIVDNWEWQ